MPKPRRLIGVVGTHTEVGKTWATAQLLASLRSRGVRVAVRKPVQSFDPQAGPTDAQQLANASGEREEEVCPAHRNYKLAMAPPMAADALSLSPIPMADVIAEITWPAGIEIGFVETVGGVRSPLAHDGDSVDLVKRLQVDEVLLVADAGLGTLNSVRLTLACLSPLPVKLFLNRFDASDDLHRRNREWLLAKDGVDALVELRDWR